METELSRRLKAVVDERYGGVARQASRAAGLHENAVMRVLEGGPHLPNLETLDKMAAAYGWELGTVAYWALGRTPPPPAKPPAEAVAAILAAANYREGDRAFIVELVRRCAPASVPVSNTE